MEIILDPASPPDGGVSEVGRARGNWSCGKYPPITLTDSEAKLPWIQLHSSNYALF